ncbi:MAG: hypothetical protein Q8S71_03740 [Hydrogenophaga sp.]|nr:hypothetical protein [Hydrogenophaga sp.]
MARNETKIDITAEDKTASAFASVGNRLLGVEQSFGKITGMIGGLSAVAAVGFIATSVKNAADFADEMGKAAQKVGTTTEALSALKYAADLSDVSFEQLQTGMGKLAKTTEDFRDGSKSAVDAFAKINLDPTKFKDTSELFAAVAEQLSKMEDGARKTAIAQELLGKSGQELIPLLNGGASGLKEMADEAERFGLVVDTRTAKASERLNDNWTRIGANATGVANSIGNFFIPALVEVTDNFIANTEKANIYIAALASIADLLRVGAVGAVDLVGGGDEQRQLELLDQIANKQKQIDETSTTGNKTAIENNRRRLIDLRKELSEVTSRLELAQSKTDAAKRPKGKDAAEPDSAVGTPKTKTAGGKTEAEKYAEDMAKLLKTFDDAAQPAQTLSEKLQAQLSTYTSLDPAVKTYLVGIVAQTKATEDAATAAEALAESNQRINDMMAATQGYDDNAQAVYNANAEAYNDLLRTTEDINASLIDNDKERARAQLEIEFTRSMARIDLLEGEEDQIAAIREAAQEKYEAQLKTLDSKTSTNKNIGKELGLTFKSAFEDAVVSGKKFGDVLDSLAQDIEKMLLRRTVTEPLMGALDGMLDSFDFGSLFNFNANGNVYQGAGISQYSGSVVSQPTMFASGGNVMGEAGPEGIFPLKRGKDGKLGVSAEGSASSSNTFNVSVNVDATGGSVAGDNNRAAELGRQIESAVRAVLLKEKRQGGVLA